MSWPIVILVTGHTLVLIFHFYLVRVQLTNQHHELLKKLEELNK